MAGLPASRATVCVAPPLLANVPSPALLTPTWLLLTPLVSPPLPPVPIRLNALAVAAVPAMSLAVVLGDAPWKLPATIVLDNWGAPPSALMPPPKTPPEPEVTRLAV